MQPVRAPWRVRSAAGHDVIVVDMQEIAWTGWGPISTRRSLATARALLVLEECGGAPGHPPGGRHGRRRLQPAHRRAGQRDLRRAPRAALVDDDALADILDDMGIAPSAPIASGEDEFFRLTGLTRRRPTYGVVIVGGRSRADYLMGALAETVDTVVAHQRRPPLLQYLSSRHDGTVIWGNGMKLAVLGRRPASEFDAIVAPTGLDADNLAICQVAKKFLGIRIPAVHRVQPREHGHLPPAGVTAAIRRHGHLGPGHSRGLGASPAPPTRRARPPRWRAAAAAEAGNNGEGDGADGTADDEGRPRCPLALPLDSGLVAPLGKRAPVTVMERRAATTLRQPIALARAGRRALRPRAPARARYVGVAVAVRRLRGLGTGRCCWLSPTRWLLAPCFIFPGIGAGHGGLPVYCLARPAWAPALPAGRPPRARCWSGFSPSPSTRCPPWWPRGCSLHPVSMRAVFPESTSGLTTTGLAWRWRSVDTCPAIFLFHRSLTCYLGGVGLVLCILTCVVTQTGGAGVYNAGGHSTTCCQATAKTARMILLVYPTGSHHRRRRGYWAAGAKPTSTP